MKDQVFYLVILVIYLAGMVGIGFFFFWRNRNVSDYILGSRKLGPMISALSAQASDMSGWLLLGLPGTAYLLWQGTAEAIWTVIGLWLGTYLNWLLVAKRLRRFTGRLDALTLPDYFTKRFLDRSGILRVASATIILVFFLFYTASMFSAGAKLFQTIFGIDYHYALLIGSAIIISYTFLGGFLAVCWTDVIQGTLMFLALCVTPILAFRYLSNAGGISHAIHEASGGVPFSLWPAGSDSLGVVMIFSALAWGLGYFGQPHILPRFMAIESENAIRIARRIAMIWVTITLIAAVTCGVVGAAIFPNLEDPETIFIHLTQNLFPPLITGILITAILSALMSTADSQLLVASSAASSDLFRDTFHPNASERSTLWVSRLTVVAISLAAVGIVFVENPAPESLLGRLNASVFQLVAFAWAGFGAAFGPVILLSLYWKRLTAFGAIAGIIGGGGTAFVWRFFSGGIFDIYEIIPGILVSTMAILLVSLLSPANHRLEELFHDLSQPEEIPSTGEENQINKRKAV